MLKTVLLISTMFFAISIFGQDFTNNDLVEKACMDYIEGFYEGDTTKLERALKPTLHKFGFWKMEGENAFQPAGQMTFEQALDYANNVREKKHFADEDALKKVEVLDVMENIASAKVTAWWGYDYILLSKEGEKWMIEQVLWQGPPKKE